MATKKATKKAAPKKAAKKAAPKKAAKKTAAVTEDFSKPDKGKPGTVSIRMYCIGTGDCFVIKFYKEDGSPYTMMIDCGSCRGDADWFAPYVTNLAGYVRNTIDLLVVTHEHQDHVNGFQKCAEIFEKIKFRNAWFAWTENPEDPDGEAAELLKKRNAMKAALGNAIAVIKKQEPDVQEEIRNSAYAHQLGAARKAFVRGLNSLAEINLNAAAGNAAKPLAGMKKIKDILAEQNTKIKYLAPGTTAKVKELPGINFHVLGPPKSKQQIHKSYKEGTDVYKNEKALDASTLAARAFTNFTEGNAMKDLPFAKEYLSADQPGDNNLDEKNQKLLYTQKDTWRKIDRDWLMSAGTLAIRLTRDINNTSLVLAVESESSGKVLLLPGDAEFGSWESWHMIPKWNKKGSDGKKHFVEDLLSRTVFYKVGHHLSYNGTALDKGISMMPESNMVSMATLDLERIDEGWTSTMPNKHLVADLTKRTEGLFFIMNEKKVKAAPSKVLDHSTLDEKEYFTLPNVEGKCALFKQYTLSFGK